MLYYASYSVSVLLLYIRDEVPPSFPVLFRSPYYTTTTTNNHVLRLIVSILFVLIITASDLHAFSLHPLSSSFAPHWPSLS